jgi:predicted urease superfamily metal-dependent hydrolase
MSTIIQHGTQNVKNKTIDILSHYVYDVLMVIPPLEANVKRKQYVTIEELARRAGRSDRVIRYWIKRGFIQYERDGLTPGARIIIPLEEAERVISQLPQGEIIESA